MTTGEEHARQALEAASLVATVRTRVIQADHEVSTIKELLESVTGGSANDLALSAVNTIYAAEQVLGETQTLLLRSAEDADAYVDEIAPGLRRGRSADPTPVPGDQLTEPPPRRRSFTGSLDRLLKATDDVEDAAKPAKDSTILFKGLEPPPTKTASGSTSPSGPQAHSAPPTPSQVDPVTATVTSVLLGIKGVQLGLGALARRWKRRQ